MNVIVKKLTLSIITFLLVLITFVTSAYAFLNIANFNLITGLEIGFNGGDMLELSFDGQTYSKSVNPNDLEGITNHINFVNVTTFDNQRFDLGPKYLEEEAEANKHYLSLDLYFRLKTTNEAYIYDHLYLGNRVYSDYDNANNLEGTYAISKGINFTSPIDFEYRPNEWILEDSTNKFYAHEALRIGVINEIDDINYIYDISEDSIMGFGKTYGAVDYYNRVITYDQLTVPNRLPDNMIYQLTEFDPGEPDVALDDTSLVSRLVLDEEDGYYKGQIKVNIWLEGWDANSFDGIYRDSIKIQLMFIAGRKR